MKERISYWLIPAEPEKSLFSGIIADLAGRFDAPKFEPHVTLYSGPAVDTARLDEIIDRSAAGISQVTLRTSGIGHSESFTKTLFVACELNETVTRLSNGLKKLSTTPADYTLEPHLSLIYAELLPGVKEALAREIAVPSFIRFNGVQAVITGEATRTKRDVETWRVAAQRLFAAERF